MILGFGDHPCFFETNVTMKHFISIRIVLLISLFQAVACKSTRSDGPEMEDPFPQGTSQIELAYAKGFELYEKDDITFIVVKDPWQGAEEVEFIYVLYPKEMPQPYFDFEAQYIPVPIESMACMSSTHVGFMHALEKTSLIQAVSGTRYLHHPELKERIAIGDLREIGGEGGLNWEVMIEVDPDLLFSYGVGSEVSAISAKIQELGMNDFMVADYLETHPLGKAEWIKALAPFVQEEAKAKQLFDSIQVSYEAVRENNFQFQHKPRVLTGLPWKEVWYLPGMDSYLAHFIADAGGNYVWSHWTKREPQALSLETVYLKAADADIWINSGFAQSLEEILSIDSRLGDFKSFREGKVFNNNKRQNEAGGNDYWETGILEPHRILLELTAILHPSDSLLMDFKYYQRLDSLKL